MTGLLSSIGQTSCTKYLASSPALTFNCQRIDQKFWRRLQQWLISGCEGIFPWRGRPRCALHTYTPLCFTVFQFNHPSTSIVYLVIALSETIKLLWCIASPATSIHPRQNSPVWWFGMQKSFAVRLVVLPESILCGEMWESTEHAFFHCLVICPLCKLIESYMARMLQGQFFGLEVSSVCSNMNSLIDRRKHFVFLCWLAMMWVIVWMKFTEHCLSLPITWLHSFSY